MFTYIFMKVKLHIYMFNILYVHANFHVNIILNIYSYVSGNFCALDWFKQMTGFMGPCMAVCRTELIIVTQRNSTRYSLRSHTRMWGYSGCPVCFLLSPKMAQSLPSLTIVSKPSGLLMAQTCIKSMR